MKKKVPLKLLPNNEAQEFLFTEFLKLEDVRIYPARKRILQIRNLVDGRDDDEVEFTEMNHLSLWEQASGITNHIEMSTQQLKESINQLKCLYSARIAEETQRFNRKIQDLKAQHDSWVAKEEEELEELIQNRIHAFNSLQERNSNSLLHSQSFCIQNDILEDHMETTEILEPSQSYSNVKSSQRTIDERPRACFFNLSDISDSSDNDII